MAGAPRQRSGTQPGPRANNPITDDTSTSFEDDLFGMFARPAVQDASSSFSTHEHRGEFSGQCSPGSGSGRHDQGAIPDDVYMNDINPLWLDWLNDSIERLPSDALDGFVPQRLPENVPAATPFKAEASVEASTLSCATTDVRADVTLASPLAPSAAGFPSAPVMMPMPLMYVPNSRIFVYKPPASVAAPAAAKMHFEAAARNADGDVKVNIDSYVPRTLRPVHPAVRAQQRASRQEALSHFREKKRRCHFKKTIRYESRQVYADVRPRIKGRFARRDEVAAMRAAGTLPPL